MEVDFVTVKAQAFRKDQQRPAQSDCAPQSKALIATEFQ